MLGANATTESVSGLTNVAWRRTLGWQQLKPTQVGRRKAQRFLTTE
jgi:hypothetical protein